MKNQNKDIGVTKIYLVTNCYNDANKVYIGKTINSREKSHKKTYGNQIEYTYIDEVNSLNRKEWEPLETYWIQQFKQWGFEIMNIKKHGGGGPEYVTDETKSKISKSNKGKHKPKGFQVGIPKPNDPNLAKALNYKEKILELYKTKSILEISNVINLDFGTIKSFLIKEEIYIKSKNHHQPVSQKEKMKQIMINKLGIPIIQQDKKGNIINEYPSQAEAFRQTGVRQTDISACCVGKQKTAGGYIWKFKN